MFIRRTLALSTLSLAAGLALSACGGASDTGSVNGMTSSTSSTTLSAPARTGTPAAGEHNDADVQFATEMIGHHRQAVQMAAMADAQAKSVQVKQLATQIKAAQAPEITQMSGWLTGWGAPVPAEGMDHSGPSMNGMMSMEQMDAMSKVQGTSFDRLFLEGMITHHQGAVAMATTELTSGSNAEAKKLARAIQGSQAREINQMKALLGQN